MTPLMVFTKSLPPPVKRAGSASRALARRACYFSSDRIHLF